MTDFIITYQEKLGNYNKFVAVNFKRINYNIPRKIRELQYSGYCVLVCKNYNIPRKIRELQLKTSEYHSSSIITYQEKLGNYNM